MNAGIRNALSGLDIIWTLTWMNFLPKSARERGKLLWVFLEPAGQLVVIMTVFSLIGRAPSYGDSFSLFLLTGVLMLTLFSTGGMLVMSGVASYRSKARLPGVGLFHAAIAKILFKLISAAVYSTILIYCVGYFEDTPTYPRHMDKVLAAFFWCATLGFGVGLIRAYSILFMPIFNRIYAVISRGLIFVSGVFFAPSFMPPQMREVLIWNPVLHAIELMRLGVYDQYPTIVFSMEYLQLWALGAVALGVTLLWSRRGEISIAQ
jgi:capsular polysaccharide transport system permease protein